MCAILHPDPEGPPTSEFPPKAHSPEVVVSALHIGLASPGTWLPLLSANGVLEQTSTRAASVALRPLCTQAGACRYMDSAAGRR
jgi:hypothetical protein